jgi:hypothetical protein
MRPRTVRGEEWRIRNSPAGSDTRSSPERPGFETPWRNIIGTYGHVRQAMLNCMRITLCGLLWELGPRHRAPCARIMPADHAATWRMKRKDPFIVAGRMCVETELLHHILSNFCLRSVALATSEYMIGLVTSWIRSRTYANISRFMLLQ